ncbi:MAG: TetR/AcrR family transcriptional regulator [Gammaproteobacteria bacterium]|nr:TetR/AcrR family transcriptional regulator [Gammaproteobacteria bacterium]
MPRDGSATRDKILDTTLELVLQSGFGSTSIDSLIDRAGITKGAFFYHFKNKQELALALVKRFSDQDYDHLVQGKERAEKLTRDPLQQLLIFVGLFEEMFDQLEEPYPGCLFGSFCYQAELFNDEIKNVIAEELLHWRKYIADKIVEIMKSHPPKLEIDVNSLADMLTTIFEGAFIMSKSLNDPKLVARQLRHYRNYLELLFDK